MENETLDSFERKDNYIPRVSMIGCCMRQDNTVVQPPEVACIKVYSPGWTDLSVAGSRTNEALEGVSDRLGGYQTSSFALISLATR